MGAWERRQRRDTLGLRSPFWAAVAALLLVESTTVCTAGDSVRAAKDVYTTRLQLLLGRELGQDPREAGALGGT